MPASASNRFSGRFAWSGYLLGFSLSGFFDGILLHQVLQWHHLLINVKSRFFQDIKNQILPDGLFHVLMCFIAMIGLWKLWKARQEFAQSGADKLLLGNAFIGFGAWHILDSILSHWILGIHRIRVDAENVLFWDMLWFAVFGVAFVVIGMMIHKRSGRPDGRSGYRNTATALILALTVVAAGPIAALPPKDVTAVMVFFKPGTTPVDIFNAIGAEDGRIIWSAGSGDVWAPYVKDKSKTSGFYDHGAFLVSNSVLAIGCLA